MRRGLFLILLAFVALVGCSMFEDSSGTATTSEKSAAPKSAAVRAGLIPQTRPPVADVPVPLGFKIAESMSRSYESAGARYVDHTYEGREDKLAVDQFYRQQMPLKGWVMRGSQMVRGTFIHRYEKANELADVTIDGGENPITGHWARVNVNIQTVGRGEPKR